jgi:Fe-S oxidoreductase
MSSRRLRLSAKRNFLAKDGSLNALSNYRPLRSGCLQHAVLAVHQRLKDPDLAQKLKPLNLRAAYHDPCHLGRMLGIFEEPRGILHQLGVDLVEMEHNRHFSSCCGGGGGLRAVDDKLSIEIAKNRVRDAFNVGADMIVTVCPTCESTLLRASGRLVNQIDQFIDVRSL